MNLLKMPYCSKKVVHGIKYNLIKPHNFYFNCLIFIFHGLKLVDQICEQQKVGIYVDTVVITLQRYIYLNSSKVNKRTAVCAKL
jgi:hypothetical protein